MRVIGGGVLALSVYFMARVLVRAWGALAVTSVSPRFWLSVTLGGVAFAASTMLLAVCWHELTRAAGARSARWPIAWLIYARSVPLKYVPGNVLHLAGRQLMGAARGYGHATLVTASALEMASLVTAAGIVATSALSAVDAKAFGISPWVLRLLPLLAAAALFGAPLVARRLAGSRDGLFHRVTLRDLYRELVTVLAGHLGFFLLSGATTAMLLWMLDPHGFSPARCGWVVLAYAGAWIAGFVAPGAPAGLGVREAVFVALAVPMVPEPLILLTSVGSRIANIIGDALFFLISEAVAGKQRRNVTRSV